MLTGVSFKQHLFRMTVPKKPRRLQVKFPIFFQFSAPPKDRRYNKRAKRLGKDWRFSILSDPERSPLPVARFIITIFTEIFNSQRPRKIAATSLRFTHQETFLRVSILSDPERSPLHAFDT